MAKNGANLNEFRRAQSDAGKISAARNEIQEVVSNRIAVTNCSNQPCESDGRTQPAVSYLVPPTALPRPTPKTRSNTHPVKKGLQAQHWIFSIPQQRRILPSSPTRTPQFPRMGGQEMQAKIVEQCRTDASRPARPFGDQKAAVPPVGPPEEESGSCRSLLSFPPIGSQVCKVALEESQSTTLGQETHSPNNRQEQTAARVISRTSLGLESRSSPTATDRNLIDVAVSTRTDVEVEAPTIPQTECNMSTWQRNLGIETEGLAAVLPGPAIVGSNVTNAEQNTIKAPRPLVRP